MILFWKGEPKCLCRFVTPTHVVLDLVFQGRAGLRVVSLSPEKNQGLQRAYNQVE